MKKYILTTFAMLCLFPVWGQETKPRITIIATGGTIAGIAHTPAENAYTPAQLTVETLIRQIPQITDKASVKGIQLCNIASQHMTPRIWVHLASVVDSLFTGDHCDGIVVTHGTDTMEETAFFLDLVNAHQDPVVLTGSMRPSNSPGADGPANLYNAVCLAADTAARGKGVLVVMNDYIFSASGVTKTHTVNPQAFDSPDHGPLGVIRGGMAAFYKPLPEKQIVDHGFSIRELANTDLPRVDIVLSYAGATSLLFDALVENGADGIVIAGVGHGNYSYQIENSAKQAVQNGVAVVRATRVLQGGVSSDTENPFSGQIVSRSLSPQKARILLMLALTGSREPAEIQRMFDQYP
ncbi:MAG TPA: L-asparaginase 2 [Rikenellaceae bacterium]|nr:L-asparaginase 2 [Rikenellaceae bacterium]